MNLKVLLMILGLSVLLVLVFSLFQVKNGENDQKVLGVVIQDLEVNPEFYDLGQVQMKDGNVVKTYEIKNTSDEIMKLKRVATSCMCTKVKIKIGDRETREFGMEGMGDKNPPINLELPSGQTATVTAIFDPAAHGPKGVGSFDRTVFLYFSNPSGTKELKFNGTVVN